MATFDQRAQNVVCQLNADTINVFQAARLSAARKNWRPLGITQFGNFPTRSAWAGFYGYLARCATECAPARNFVQFTVFMAVDEFGPDDGKAHRYMIVAPYAALTTGLDRQQDKLRDMIQQYNAIPQGDARRLALREKEVAEAENFSNKWQCKFATNQLIGRPTSCVQVSVDRQAMSVDLREAPVVSTDPQDYHNHVRATSEAIAFVTAYLTTPTAVANIDWALDCYPLMKLFLSLMDQREARFGSFSVNVDDEEEWDFSYPQLDEAIATAS